MQQITLGNTSLQCPPLGFGCASMMGRVGRRPSLRALATAWDTGIRFFDTARSYGYGESEVLLGEFLRDRRDQSILATKFGILASPQPTWKRFARSAARGILKAAPWTHRALQRRAASQFAHHQFTIPVLQQSLDQSLRALRTDYVDILFLHAAPASVLEQDDLLDAMQRLVQAGKVRFTGLSADPEVVALALDRKIPQLHSMQFPCNVFEITAATRFASLTDGTRILVANHPYGGAARIELCRRILTDLVSAPDRLAHDPLDSALREKLGSLDDACLADIILNVILRETGIHIVLPSMMQVEHIHANVRAIESSRFTSAEIRSIRSALTPGTTNPGA